MQSQRQLEIVSGRLNHIERDELVELHSKDARELGIVEGDKVEVRTPTGRLQGIAAVTSGGSRGVVSSTGLFGQLAVELQASEEPEPMSRVAGLVVSPAAVAKI